jgi:hypothetical protein
MPVVGIEWCRRFGLGPASRTALHGFERVPVAPKIPPDVDAFQWKLQWAVVYVSGLYDQNKIDRQTESWFNGEVFGALAGKSSQQRESERLSTIIHESFNLPVLREGDDGPLLPADLGSSDLPALCGVEIKVRLVPTATGINPRKGG